MAEKVDLKDQMNFTIDMLITMVVEEFIMNLQNFGVMGLLIFRICTRKNLLPGSSRYLKNKADEKEE